VSILSNSKDAQAKWVIFTQIAVWILSITSTFIVKPPLLKVTAEGTTQSFVRFLVAAIIAFIFIPTKKRSQKKDYSFWLYCAGISLVIALVLTPLYNNLVNNWSVDFYGSSLVKGKTMFSEAAIQKDSLAPVMNRPFIDDQTFVKTRLGDTQYIWPEHEIKDRYYKMTVLYILVILSYSIFLISITQAIYCNEKADPTPTV
jgi:hypothetical protein